MAEQKVTEYIVIQKPSFAVSILEDIFSFGGFIALMWFNHTYLNGNGWLDLLFIVGWIMTVGAMQSRRYHKFRSLDRAIDYLNEVKKERDNG